MKVFEENLNICQKFFNSRGKLFFCQKFFNSKEKQIFGYKGEETSMYTEVFYMKDRYKYKFVTISK